MFGILKIDPIPHTGDYALSYKYVENSRQLIGSGVFLK